MDKVLSKLQHEYPDIQWGIAEPDSGVLEAFGNGMVLFGKKDGKQKEFFILEEDKNRLKWGKVIANYLNGEQ
jgi:hypothetical protein